MHYVFNVEVSPISQSILIGSGFVL